MFLIALLLLWLFVVVALYTVMNHDGIPGTKAGVAKVKNLFGPKCPTCGDGFTPDKCAWETSTACLDGKDYCANCKVKGMCGC